jgi:hypothetical protein
MDCLALARPLTWAAHTALRLTVRTLSTSLRIWWLAASFGVAAARLLPGKRLWNVTGLAVLFRQAGDQGCCGVEVRGFEPLASSVRASWG